MARKTPPTTKATRARGHDVLFSEADSVAILSRFGALPGTQARRLMVAPPPTTDGRDPAEVMAHDYWYETWKATRRKGIGASEVAAIAGIPGAYGSPFALWWNKKAGLEVDQDSDEILVMGTKLEEIIGGEWAERNPQAMLVRPGSGLYGHPVWEWLMATPDFLAVSMMDGDPWPVVEPVECKAYDGGKGWGTPGTDEVPEHILCQLAMQCEVLGARRGHVARMRGKKITTYTVDMYPTGDEGRRRALIEVWQRRAESFWNNVEQGSPPPIDGSDATEAVLAFQFADVVEDLEHTLPAELVDRYRWAVEHANQANRTLALARNQVRAEIGNAEFGVSPTGDKVCQRRVYKRSTYTVAAGVVDGVWPVGGQR